MDKEQTQKKYKILYNKSEVKQKMLKIKTLIKNTPCKLNHMHQHRSLYLQIFNEIRSSKLKQMGRNTYSGHFHAKENPLLPLERGSVVSYHYWYDMSSHKSQGKRVQKYLMTNVVAWCSVSCWVLGRGSKMFSCGKMCFLWK